MKGTINIAVHLAPKGYKEFCKWHKLAAPNDPLTSEQRFVEMGGEIPTKNVSKRSTSVKKKK